MDWHHFAVGLLTLTPLPPTSSAGSSSPLGRYGPLVATVVAIAVVLSALVVHLAAVFDRGTGTDPFIDSAALLVIGVVLGASALGGRTDEAHAAAVAANRRLDKIAAPPASDGDQP